MFNEEGNIPVHSTEKDILHSGWENDWWYLPLIKALAALAGLFHDWGKASGWFQKKLVKEKIIADLYRHEWISCKLLEAVVLATDASDDDRKWLNALANGNLKTEDIGKYLRMDEDLDESKLPPLAKWLIWLILSHHKMPMQDKELTNMWVNVERSTFQSLFAKLNASWGYKNEVSEDKKKECFSFPKGLLLEDAPVWQKTVKKWCRRLAENYDKLSEIIKEGENYRPCFRAILYYARLSLMLADHYISSLPEEKDEYRWMKKDLWANTDGKTGEKKQYLEEHLVRVAEQAVSIAHRLPYFAGEMESVYGLRELAKKSPAPFRWQDKAVEKIRSFRERNGEDSKFFIVNMASTGCGKTFANAKIMQAVSEDGKSLRYILALGLRTLTLQTGDEYRERIGLGENDLAVLIGSRSVSELHDKKKEEEKSSEKEYSSETELLPEDLKYIDTENEEQTRFLDIFFNKKDRNGSRVNEQASRKNRAFLYKPVLVATIDHIMGATETVRGGRYILPLLRLMSSDLVIDEIDDFGKKDLIAIARLVHLAGLCGRNVGISSATIPPDLAEGLYRSYRAGLKVYNSFFKKEVRCAAVLCDEFSTEAEQVNDDECYRNIHDGFIGNRVKKLKDETVKRRGYIQDCEKKDGSSEGQTREEAYFENMRKAIETLHDKNHVTDKKTGKNVSFGVVRLANINPCVKAALYFMKCEWGKETAVRVMVYHSRQILLLRHEQEKYLDKVLKRKKQGEIVDFQDKAIRKHLDQSKEKNVIFVLVATPVEEVGRDHDFDWAVVEPSSYRSIIQLAGRVLRHRMPLGGKPVEKNMAIMACNLKALNGDKPAYVKPGYETNSRKLKSYDMHELVDESKLAEKIDAVPRIEKSEALKKEQFRPDDSKVFETLSDLEQASMMDFNCKEDFGPQCMHGWTEEYWWLTALPQCCNRFRESYGEELEACAVYTEGKKKFLSYEKVRNNTADTGKNSDPTGYVHVSEYNGIIETMRERLWLNRDYTAALKQYVSDTEEESEEEQMTAISKKYGEIIIPDRKSDVVDPWTYDDQLGVFKL